MCRLFAQVAKKEEDASYWFFDADRRTFVSYCNSSYSEGYSDGFGIGWYKNSKLKLFKQGKDEVKSIHCYNFKIVNRVKSNVIISHLRRASKSIGNTTTQNAHPFVYKNWLFAHHGYISRAHNLQYLDEEYRAKLHGTTDSEVFFLLIMQAYESQKEKDIVKAIKSVILQVKKYSHNELHFILCDGKSLYAYRDVNPHAKDGRDYHFYYLKQKSRIVFCSNPLSHDSWEEIPMRTLVEVDSKTLKFKEIKLF